ncbi:MAG: hypothetical protein JNL01_03100 [Bdellovibrionales bacterium]|nr:hypothetical protein [Bdellovibrionales bacterium]
MMNKTLAYISVVLASLMGSSAFAAEATTSDKFAQVRGFKVEISGHSGKEVDSAWEAMVATGPVLQLDGRLKNVGTLVFSGGDSKNDAVSSRTIYLNNCKPSGCQLRVTVTPVAEDSKGELYALETFSFSSCSPSHDMRENSDESTLTLRCDLPQNRAVQNETRRFQTLSNASKVRHETALNAIRNMK